MNLVNQCLLTKKKKKQQKILPFFQKFARSSVIVKTKPKFLSDQISRGFPPEMVPKFTSCGATYSQPRSIREWSDDHAISLTTKLSRRSSDNTESSIRSSSCVLQAGWLNSSTHSRFILNQNHRIWIQSFIVFLFVTNGCTRALSWIWKLQIWLFSFCFHITWYIKSNF